MSDRPHGKHCFVDADSPLALGICDKTGFVFRHIDLVRQMEWYGNSLRWTGFMVGKPYVDQPNEQLRPPILPPDPVPVENPRLQQPSPVVWSNQSISWPNTPVDAWVDWSGSEDGIPAAPQAQRLAALQVQQQPSTTFGSAAQSSNPQLTQQQILDQLQNIHWGN